MPPLAEELDELLIIQCVNIKIVGIKGIEPIQPKDNRFTVCPDSPTSAYSHVSTTPSKNGIIPQEVWFQKATRHKSVRLD